MRGPVRLPLEQLQPYLFETSLDRAEENILPVAELARVPPRSLATSATDEDLPVAELARVPPRSLATSATDEDLPVAELARVPPRSLATSATDKVNWETVFGNAGPVEIEVGFGKGMFLLTAGQQHPEVNFFGIEIERKYQLFTANRVAKRKLSNVRLACTDGRAFLSGRVPAGSVQAVHVYFPDPWWKKRHHKRRLFTAEFASACLAVLQAGGRLEVMTDVQEYFDIITALLAALPLLRRLPAADRGADYRTNFERKYRLAGKPIYGASYQVLSE